MKKIVKTLAIVGVVGTASLAATQADAWWWGGPFNGNGIGDGAFSMNMSSNVRGNGYGYGNPHYGGYPYYGGYPHYGAPYAPVGFDRTSIEAHQDAIRKQMEAQQEAIKAHHDAMRARFAPAAPKAETK